MDTERRETAPEPFGNRDSGRTVQERQSGSLLGATEGPACRLDSCYLWVERHTSWAKGAASSALLVVALSLLLGAFPPIRRLINWQPSWPEQALDWKLHHPFEAIPVEQFAQPGHELRGLVNHLRKRTYRLTLPLIAHYVGLDSRGMEILSLLSSLAFSVVILLYFRKLVPEQPVISLLLAVSVACSLLGQWGTYGYYFFDGVGFLLLACAAYSENPVLIAIFLVAGGFSDERVILAAPLLWLLHGRSDHPSNMKLLIRALLKPVHCQYGVVAGVFLFIALRVIFGMYIGQQFDRAEVGFASLGKNMMLFPLAWLLVFKGATIVMAIGLLCLWNFRSDLSVVLILIALLPGIAASLLVWDLCRSLCFTFPILLFCTKALLRTSSLQTIRRAALCGALISACLPTYYHWEDSIRYLPTLFSRILKV